MVDFGLFIKTSGQIIYISRPTVWLPLSSKLKNNLAT